MNYETAMKRIQKIGAYPYFTRDSTELKYFVDYRGSNGYLLAFSPTDFYFYTDTRYIEAYRESIGADRVQLLDNYSTTPWLPLFEELLRRDFSRVYMDYRLFTYKDMLAMRERAQSLGVSIEELPVGVDRLRLVKDEEEIQTIKKSQEMNEKAFAGIIALLKEGVSERDIAAEFEYLVKKQGAEGISFSSIIVFGRKSSYPHGVPGDNKLQLGDVVLIDAGVLWNNYCSDMTRTLSFGEPKESSFKNHYQILLQAQKDCLDIIDQTERYADLDRFVRDQLEKHDLAKYFTHSLGHGVGIDIHEIPRIYYTKNEETIQPGHVFTVEPGIYLEGHYGIRIEDMIYIRPDGKSSVISKFPKELKIL